MVIPEAQERVEAYVARFLDIFDTNKSGYTEEMMLGTLLKVAREQADIENAENPYFRTEIRKKSNIQYQTELVEVKYQQNKDSNLPKALGSIGFTGIESEIVKNMRELRETSEGFAFLQGFVWKLKMTELYNRQKFENFEEEVQTIMFKNSVGFTSRVVEDVLNQVI